MGSVLVTEDTTHSEGDGRKNRPSPILRYSDEFEKMCGYYLSMGMSYHDYWDGDNCMVRYYRDKFERETTRANYLAWLQGAYIYEALIDVSPAFNPLSSRHKPFPYRDDLIPITSAQSKATQERVNNQKMQNGKEAMRALAAEFNKRFKEEKEG